MRDLLEDLLRSRGAQSAWPYRRGLAASTEATSLAALACWAGGLNGRELLSAADWLRHVQGMDGSLAVTERFEGPGWATPLAVLVWTLTGKHEGARRRAISWLLRQKGTVIAARADRAIGHDPSITGWPWVSDTHSWLEPTAMTVIALRRAGLGDHSRVREGLRLIRDRAIATGGWNYGNSSAFGRDLRPQPGPTGLALLALAGTCGSDAAVDQALAYLEDALPRTRAGRSLGWGLLGLRAWGRMPHGAAGWLREAAGKAVAGPSPTMALALVVLAGADRGVDPFSAAEGSADSCWS